MNMVVATKKNRKVALVRFLRFRGPGCSGDIAVNHLSDENIVPPVRKQSGARGRETERFATSQATAPFLDSTVHLGAVTGGYGGYAVTVTVHSTREPVEKIAIYPDS